MKLFITFLKRIRVVASPFQTLHAADDGVDVLVAQGSDELLELVLVHGEELSRDVVTRVRTFSKFSNFVFEI